MSIRIKLSDDLGNTAKIESLYYIIYELAQGLYADHQTLEYIKKGVLDNQILSVLYISYQNKNNQTIAKVSIRINWKKYSMLCSCNNREFSEIDSLKSNANTKTGLHNILSNMLSRIPVNDCAVLFHFLYRDEILNDESLLLKANNILGISSKNVNDTFISSNIIQKIKQGLKTKKDTNTLRKISKE